MFEEALIESTTHKMQTNVRWYFLSTMIVYALLLSALLTGSIMLLSPQLKEPFISAALVLPPPPPPALGAGAPRQPTMHVISSNFLPPTKFVPSTLKPLSAMTDMLPDVGGSGFSEGVSGGDPSGRPDGISGGDPNGVQSSVALTTAALPPPKVTPEPKTKTPSPSTPRRISGGVLQGNAIRRVQPAYPTIARSARVAGSVEVEVVIDESGNVISASVVQGHPLLRQAAVEAADQWKFRPTLLSGTPIKVTGILVFNFRL